MAKYVSAGRHFDVNLIVSNNHEVFIAFCDLLDDAGWTFIQSSDGTTPGAMRNDVARWSNNNAWEHWRDPSDRDLTIQRGTTDRSWRGYVGKAGVPFTGGTGATAPTDSAARVQIIGGSDNFNTTFLVSVPTGDRYHMMVDSAGRGTTGDVHEFYMHSRSSSTGTASTANFARHALLTIADGTVGDADVEPWLTRYGYTANAGLGGWYLAGLVGESRRTTLRYDAVTGIVWGTNPYTGERDYGPFLASDQTAGFLQRKGWLETVGHPTGLEADMDTYNLAIEGRSAIRFGSQAIVPWPHGVSPVVP